MDAFIGQRFEDFETIAGVNVIKLYGDSLLSARLDAQSVGEILVRLVVLVIVQLILPAVDDGLGLLRRFAVQGKTIALIGGIGRLSGAVWGAVIYVLLQELLTSHDLLGPLSEHWLLWFGMAIIVIVALLPQGVMGEAERWMKADKEV